MTFKYRNTTVAVIYKKEKYCRNTYKTSEFKSNTKIKIIMDIFPEVLELRHVLKQIILIHHHI